MLGEQISENVGKIIGRRVIQTDGEMPRVEVSFETEGKLLGQDARTLGTYYTIIRPDGSMYGEGQGVTILPNGNSASWKAQGTGKFTGRGNASSIRGSLFYQTKSSLLSRLNEVATVFEFDSDDQDKVTSKLFEWR
jgi:hypothetical protein